MGRRRTKDHDCPLGVREIEGRWYWSPTTVEGRAERKRRKLSASVALGIAKSFEACTKWALLTGQVTAHIKPGTVNELLTRWESEAIKVKPNGKARADSTIAQYKECLPAIRKRFSEARYAKTEIDAMNSRGLNTADIQQFVDESGTLGKRRRAVMKNSFDYGIRLGLTTYNPCDKSVAKESEPRTREPLEWEVECLSVMATPVVALIIAYKGVSGYRVSEVIGTRRRQLTADGIRVKPGKGAQHEILLWSPEVRRIVTEAEALPNATIFPASPLFPNARGRAYTYSGFNTAWGDLREKTNAALDVGIIDPDTLQVYDSLVIEDLVFHDLRSKVHDDAVEMGRKGHEAIGDTEDTANRHYARRDRKRRPLR